MVNVYIWFGPLILGLKRRENKKSQKESPSYSYYIIGFVNIDTRRLSKNNNKKKIKNKSKRKRPRKAFLPIHLS